MKEKRVNFKDYLKLIIVNESNKLIKDNKEEK